MFDFYMLNNYDVIKENQFPETISICGMEIPFRSRFLAWANRNRIGKPLDGWYVVDVCQWANYEEVPSLVEFITG